MSKIFDGLDIVVTGGTGALGSSVVRQLLARGATCHVPCRSRAPTLEGEDGAGVIFVEGLALTDEPALDEFYGSLAAPWASIHCAGAFHADSIVNTELAVLDRMLDANARASFACSRSAARALLRRGNGGRIINVVAPVAIDPKQGAGAVAYTMSKAAAWALSVSLAEELRHAGILVDAVSPGTMDTPANRTAMPDTDPASWVTLDEVARVLLELAAPDARTSTGSIVSVPGPR